jgi:uncharacterized protein YbjT (DUF2867 family)
MLRVLVTGATGTLGRELTPRLVKGGHIVRAMSRRACESSVESDVEWAQADIATGTGLEEAVRGVDAVMHCATSPQKNTWETDIDGTRRLLKAAKVAGVSNFYYISIVGIDRIKTGYYKAKLAAEKAIGEGGVPYTILRATQLYPLLDNIFLPLLLCGPLMFLPGVLKFQPIDAGEVASHMADTLVNGPGGRLPDIGGPQVQTLRQIADNWLRARGRHPLVVPVPALGPLSGMKQGHACCPENKFGKITWPEWLTKRYQGNSFGGVR